MDMSVNDLLLMAYGQKMLRGLLHGLGGANRGLPAE